MGVENGRSTTEILVNLTSPQGARDLMDSGQHFYLYRRGLGENHINRIAIVPHEYRDESIKVVDSRGNETYLETEQGERIKAIDVFVDDATYEMLREVFGRWRPERPTSTSPAEVLSSPQQADAY